MAVVNVLCAHNVNIEATPYSVFSPQIALREKKNKTPREKDDKTFGNCTIRGSESRHQRVLRCSPNFLFFFSPLRQRHII